MTSGFLPPIDRISYLDGQALVAADFNEDESNDARYRALHDRYLHRTWGIAVGLDAAIAPGAKAAIVQPGYAVDRAGRDVLVSKESAVPAPVLASPQVLLLAATADGGCAWWTARTVDIGAQVPLMAAYVAGGTIAGTSDFSVRRYVHSFAGPRIATGATEAGHTGWNDGAGPALWIEATIDTTAAGFVKSAQYFAALEPADAQLVVIKAGPQSLVVRALSGSFTAAKAEAAGWTVTWIGIESGGGE